MSHPIIEKLAAAWNAHQVGDVLALYTPDALLLHPMRGGEPARGRDAIAALEQPMFSAFSETEWKPLEVVRDGDRVVVEYLVKSKNTGPLPTPKGPIPATGRTVHVHGMSILRIAPNGLIAEERRFFDALGMMAQLGLA